MQLYTIRRRNYWRNPAALEASAARSRKVGEEDMPDKVRWIRTYVVQEADGKLGTMCIYEAVSADALREHAACADIPADEIAPVATTVVIRPDPAAQ